MVSESVHPIRASKPRPAGFFAWRFWPLSPTTFKASAKRRAVLDDVIRFSINRQIAAIGYVETPLYQTPSDRNAFLSDGDLNRSQRDITYQFAWQMKRGDIMCLCRDSEHVVAWGLLLDDAPLYFHNDDPIWRELEPLRDRVWEFEGEQLRNYRRVDHWRVVNMRPKNETGRLTGGIRATVASYYEATIVRLLDIKEDLKEARRSLAASVTHPETYQVAPVVSRKGSGQGRQVDPGRRDAAEWRAMELAQRYYEQRGFKVDITAEHEAFDLLCSKGQRKRRVEVKGSTQSAVAVTVTRNEVDEACFGEDDTDLFVVTGITIEGHGDDARASGGTCTLYRCWKPDDDDLDPTEYRYTLPAGGKVVNTVSDEEE